jgi:hypothetical protein
VEVVNGTFCASSMLQMILFFLNAIMNKIINLAYWQLSISLRLIFLGPQDTDFFTPALLSGMQSTS